jgi:hypothetical protein
VPNSRLILNVCQNWRSLACQFEFAQIDVLCEHRLVAVKQEISWSGVGCVGAGAEVGESMKTAQVLLGHSDLETTLNIYAHALPASQRRAVNRVSEVLFTSVLELGENQESAKRN